jgi:hypothetical protein
MLDPFPPLILSAVLSVSFSPAKVCSCTTYRLEPPHAGAPLLMSRATSLSWGGCRCPAVQYGKTFSHFFTCFQRSSSTWLSVRRMISYALVESAPNLPAPLSQTVPGLEERNQQISAGSYPQTRQGRLENYRSPWTAHLAAPVRQARRRWLGASQASANRRAR